MSESGGFSIRNTTKGKLPRLPFSDLKDTVLGAQYDLSLAFVGPLESRKLNRRYRNKDKSANVLSFPLSKTEGEIVICPAEARKDAPTFGETYPRFTALLYIHGMLHLKGFVHGSKMERQEAAVRKKFGLDRKK